MSAIVFCVPYMDRAKGELSNFHDAPYDNTAFMLDMNPNFSVARNAAAGDNIISDFNADGVSVESGTTLLEWKDDSQAYTSVQIDFGAVWLANWKLFAKSTADGNLRFSSTLNSAYTSLSTRQSLLFNQMKGPLMARRFPSADIANDRYWQLWFNAVTDKPEISFVCIGRSYKIDAQWNYNAPDSRRHLNIIDELDSGRVLVRSQNKRGIQVRMLRFELLTTADYEKIRDAHRDARGRYMPIIVGTVVDNPSVGEYIDSPRLMRFATDELQEEPVQAGLYNVDVPLIEVPWLERPYAY